MRRPSLLLGVALLLLESGALACSCVAPAAPEGARAAARAALGGASAIVEVQVISPYDRIGRIGERLRVVRLLWGKAPRSILVHRPRVPSSAACDIDLPKAARKVLILYPVGERRAAYAVHNLCSDYLVADPAYRAVTLAEARRLRPR